MSHTPGPWKIYDGRSRTQCPIITDSIPDRDGNCVANCICYVASTNPDIHDNAKLIAAAPQMLAALKAFRDQTIRWLSDGNPESPQVPRSIFEQVEAAIAAAEGKQ